MRLVLVVITALTLAWPFAATAQKLTAQDGRLTLPQEIFRDRIFDLNGSWRFYPNQILPIDAACTGGGLLDLMDYWLAAQLQQHPEWNGTSTFCLEIDNPNVQTLSFWWPERSAVDVYANGRLVFGRGLFKKGDNADRNRRQTGTIHLPAERKITVLIHANNEFMRWRKIRGQLLLGDTIGISRGKEHKLFKDTGMVTALLVTGFYQFALFVIHRTRRETFFLGFFCFFLALRHASVGHSNVVSIMAPDLLGNASFAVGHVGYFMAASCFYQFLSISYPGLMHRWILKCLWVLSVTFSLICAVLGSPVYAFTLLSFHLFGCVAMLSALYGVGRALWQKREGSLVLAIGTVFLSLTASGDMLRSQGMGLGFDVFPIGQLVFVTAASLLVSIRFSYAFDVLSHLTQELSKIVPLHVIPLLRAGTRLEKCMPTIEQEAVVLVFDVVGSSKVKHPDFRKALDTCMGRFFDAINHDYDAERLEATGYRVKEMGDGMICTVGFPFRVPQGKAPDTVALRLAQRMCAIFHEEMARLDTPEPVYCGIGLARGRVEGFFPRSGQKQYDLRGAPLTLATRYEAMRNPVYRRFGKQGSVIFIHDAVYQNLAAADKMGFQRWDTSLPGQAIRDDEKASQAWFKFVDKDNEMMLEVS
ncbi:7TM diverse intracellular signaling domain-containing protein [Oligoflexus tunisiensis]|uniref:7TM diverse intracellular signaling domain-containing protein n=1 Tax=Oligoflexus tunisiensis TaxID=708132 RepID=UPI00159F20F1|nr:7TM diverse intracellular signaling domain-containing protein [Oligoflexus tunisiensis]